MKKDNKPSGLDQVTFYGNHFLASEVGQALLKDLFKGDNDFAKQLSKQVETHNTIMEDLKKKALNVSLDVNEGNAILPPQVRIPQNYHEEQKPAPSFPYLQGNSDQVLSSILPKTPL